MSKPPSAKPVLSLSKRNPANIVRPSTSTGISSVDVQSIKLYSPKGYSKKVAHRNIVLTIAKDIPQKHAKTLSR